ncbi:MAG TPA: STY0301 family protein [Nitrospira sp.]|nr:STY0301 family protein [Nitrospira sp.]
MLRRVANLCLGIVLTLTGLLRAAPVFPATKVTVALQCPPVLATTVVAKKYRDWSIYSNDPLRLTGADVAYVVDHEDALLDPDETRQLNDGDLSEVQIFRLTQHRDVKEPELVCHYGVHAQLSRDVPRAAVECKVVHHGRFGPEESEFEASCR